MKKNLIILLVFFFITFLNVKGFSQKHILVTKGNFFAMGWGKAQVDSTLKSPTPSIRKPTTDFVYITCGPDNPNLSLKPGSVYLGFPGTNHPTLYRIILNNNSYAGTNLKDITELKYSTYTVATTANTTDASDIPGHTPIAPLLLLQIDMDGDGKIIENINFHPIRQDASKNGGGTYPVKPGKWQEWDALNGLWVFFKRNTVDPYNMPGLFSIADFVHNFPNAKIVNTDFNAPFGGPGIRFLLTEIPNFADYSGYIDAFTIKTPLGTIIKPGSQSGHLIYDFKADGNCSNK